MKTRGTLLFVLLTALPLMAQEAPRSNPADKDDSPLSLTLEGPIDAELAPTAGHLTTLFYECYPKLLKRFENPDKPAERHIRLVFKNDIKVPGYSSGNTVTVSIDWLKQHPQDLGLLTHELTHLAQAYPSANPGWLTEGIADYARHLYGPAQQPGWQLPEQLRPNQSYTDSYGVTARFLVWLDEKHPGVVDKLHRRMQSRTFEVEDFEKFTGKDIHTLWRECVKELAR